MFWLLSKNITIADLLTGHILSELEKQIELDKKRKQKEENTQNDDEDIQSVSEVTISMTSHDLDSTSFNIVHTSLPDTDILHEPSQHESKY